MKLGIIFVVLGILGVISYLYFQFFTVLGLEYQGVVTERIAGHDVVTEILWARDWTVGIGSAIIGLILVVIGGVRLGKIRRKAVTSA